MLTGRTFATSLATSFMSMALVVACSSDDTAKAEATAPAVQTPGTGDPSNELHTSDDECIETSSTRNSGGQPTVQSRLRWDATQRILTQEPLGTEGASGTVFQWRYDAAGRVVAYVGLNSSTFQHDYRYDAHGNTADFRLSYPAAPDVNVPSPASTWIGVAYDIVYDATGTLSSSTRTPYGDGAGSLKSSKQVFHEDASGRCDHVDAFTSSASSPDYVVTYFYDTAGRMHQVTTHWNSPPSGLYFCADLLEVHSYDEQGRPTGTKRWCGTTTEGLPDRILNITYLPDGGRRRESIDFTSDTPNDTIDGRSAERYVTERTAACATIDAAMNLQSDSHCHPN